MNTLIANQYGRVQGEVSGNGLVLAVAAETPRRDSVNLQTRIDSVEQQLHLLAILKAVDRRIDQFQLRDSNVAQAHEPDSPFDEAICGEGELFNSNGATKNRIYGRFAQFLIYEQLDHGRLRVFLAVRDEAKRVARFDLHPGEVQALQALVKRSLFRTEQIDLLLRDDISLTVALTVSAYGMRFDVQSPLWHSQFNVCNANEVATLSVFTRRAIDQDRVAPIRFGNDKNMLTLRKRTDGQILAEFQHQDLLERITLSSLHLYELEILAEHVLRRAFEPSHENVRPLQGKEAMTASPTA